MNVERTDVERTDVERTDAGSTIDGGISADSKLIIALDTSTEAIAIGLAEVGSDGVSGGTSAASACGSADTTTSECVSDNPADTATGECVSRMVEAIKYSDSIPARRCANQRLLPSIQEMMEKAGISKSQIAAVVCGRGPGSFTGVRIGVATAKGMASGLGCPLHGVSTLDAVAWQVWLDGRRGVLGVVGDALRKEVYPVRYVLDDTGVTRLDHDAVDKPDLVASRWAERYAEKGEVPMLAGDGLAKFRDKFENAFAARGAGYQILPEELWNVTGAGLLLAYAALAQAGELGSGNPQELLPVYTRLSDAEENEKARLAEGKPMRGVLVNPVDFVEKSDSEGGLDPSSVDDVPQSGVALDEQMELVPGGISTEDLTGADLEAEHPLILALESSCDETAAAIVDGSKNMVADLVASQIDFHKRFGGVVPEIASRKHTEAIVGLVDETMERAGEAYGLGRSLRWSDLDAIAVTQGPGLVGALVVGMAFAKGASWATGLPLIGVNHLEGHIYANQLSNPGIEPPMVVTLLSGGHTMLVHVKDWGDYKVMGQTLDDAVGEAFDKVSKALGLGYPGGPVISRYAAQGNPDAIDFPRAMLHSHDYRFSLSGLKTAVMTYIKQEVDAGREINVPDLAASFQRAVIDVQVAKAVAAVKETDVKEFCLGGGVAANPELRQGLSDAMEKLGVNVTLPEFSACTDNAGMIAAVALDSYKAGRFIGLDADSIANMPL